MRTLVTRHLLPVLTVALAVQLAPSRGSASVSATATPEALLARGIAHAEGSGLAEGLEELRAAASARPGWRPARAAYGTVLLRAGRFEEAAREFTSALGPEVARPLSDGIVGADALEFDVDAESLLGLATARHFMGSARVAERLYRAYADLVGPTAPEAGRAYQRLGELFSESDSEWVDASAEFAKASAVAPELSAASVLPRFPDPGLLPELAPYVAALTLMPDSSDSSEAPVSAPMLDAWAAHADTGAAATALSRGEVPLEILVDAKGAVESVEALGTWAEAEGIEELLETVRGWRFAPALSTAGPVPAWVLYGPTGDAAPAGGAEPAEEPEEAVERPPDGEELPHGEGLLPGEGE